MDMSPSIVFKWLETILPKSVTNCPVTPYVELHMQLRFLYVTDTLIVVLGLTITRATDSPGINNANYPTNKEYVGRNFQQIRCVTLT